MMKQGNNHSSLLDQLTKIASTEKKEEVSFDKTVLEALKAKDQPSLRDIIADVAKGKNINRTAQWDSVAKPMPEPPLGEGLQDGQGPHGFGGPDLEPEDTLDTAPVEPEGDVESAKQNLAQALVDLCGGPEAACDCINTLGGAEELETEVVPDELGGEELGGEELGDEMLSAPMEAPAPMEMPSPM